MLKILFLLFFQCSLFAFQNTAVDKLSGTLTIQPERNHISAKITYHCVPAHHEKTDSIAFYLPISFTIKKSILSENYRYEEVIDTTTRLGSMFKTILISKNRATEMRPFDLHLVYEGQYDLGNGFLPKNWPENWIEVSPNTLFFTPLTTDFKPAQLDLEIKTAPDYDFLAAGEVAKVGAGIYTLKSQKPSMVSFLLGKNLDIQEFTSKNSKTTIASYQANDSLIQAIAETVNFSIDFYNTTFGKRVPRREVKIIVRPLSEWDASFSHVNSYFATYDPKEKFFKNQSFYFGTYVHEIAHFWWLHANAATTENWINESFAEYASLLVERAYYGEKHFQKEIAKHQKKADKVPEDISLTSYKRYGKYDKTMAYSEGTLVLYFLHQQVGDEAFYNFLSKVDEAKLNTTTAIFELIAERFSGDWIEEIRARMGL